LFERADVEGRHELPDLDDRPVVCEQLLDGEEPEQVPVVEENRGARVPGGRAEQGFGQVVAHDARRNPQADVAARGLLAVLLYELRGGRRQLFDAAEVARPVFLQLAHQREYILHNTCCQKAVVSGQWSAVS
jgi:hypothetical protein